MKAQEAFDALRPEERLAVLASLGFEVAPEYHKWDEPNLRFNWLLYDVATEVIRCYVGDKWTASPPASKAKRASTGGSVRSMDMEIIRQGMLDNLDKIKVAMERRRK